MIPLDKTGEIPAVIADFAVGSVSDILAPDHADIFGVTRIEFVGEIGKTFGVVLSDYQPDYFIFVERVNVIIDFFVGLLDYVVFDLDLDWFGGFDNWRDL